LNVTVVYHTCESGRTRVADARASAIALHLPASRSSHVAKGKYLPLMWHWLQPRTPPTRGAHGPARHMPCTCWYKRAIQVQPEVTCVDLARPWARRPPARRRHGNHSRFCAAALDSLHSRRRTPLDASLDSPATRGRWSQAGTRTASRRASRRHRRTAESSWGHSGVRWVTLGATQESGG
jgi:hypothetical protein